MGDPNSLVAEIIDDKQRNKVINYIWFLDTGSIYDGTSDIILLDNGRSQSDRWFFINSRYYPIFDKDTGIYKASAVNGKYVPVRDLHGNDSTGLLFVHLGERGVPIPFDLVSKRRL
jgi:hypothetical protein